MPPNTVDLSPIESVPQPIISDSKLNAEISAPVRFREKYGLMTIMSGINLFAHILIGIIVSACYIFALRSGLPLGATPLHIILCVTGYILLMAEAILSLSNHNGWSSKYRLVDKRRAHWILQILGSGLAVFGSIYKILDKNVHWNTYHGQFALVALVFTSVSLVNGLTSLWAYELRGFLPANLSKITHICFGTVGFAAACICLCYGMDKGSFRGWIGNDALTSTFISFVAILCFVVIVTPAISIYTKGKGMIIK